jgi:hypothetical protein
MKRFRIMGLALLALLALGAFAANAAFAAEEGFLPITTVGTGEGGTAKLENTNNEKATATIHFTGCKANGVVPANSLGDASEVILSKVNVTVCLVESAKLVFGLVIEPTATEHIEIPAIGALALVKGIVIARNTGANKGKEFTFSLKGSKGEQTEALTCEILGKKFKHSFEDALDSEAKDFPASEEATFKIKFPAEATFEDAS